MKEGVVFLEKDFWRSLHTKGKRKALFLVCEMMAHAEVHTNVDKETVLEDEDLSQAYNDNGGRFVFDYDTTATDYINSSEIVPLSSVYLVSGEKSSCEEMKTTRGITILNEDSAADNYHIFENREKWIGKNEVHVAGWMSETFKDILAGNWCNSMVVIDPHICKVGRLDKVNENLTTLLDAVLPKTRLSLTFHLSIICELLDQTKGRLLHKKIGNEIKRLRPDLDVKFTLYHSHDIHDRVIVTNSFMLKIGAGFALFNKGRVVNDTTLERFYPFGKKQEYNNRLIRANTIHNKSFSNENLQSFWGDKNNRLFDLVN